MRPFILLALLAGSVLLPVRAAILEQQRGWFLAAEQALERGNVDEARRLAALLDGYPLQAYLRSRILTIFFGDDAEIRAFLESQGDSRPAAPLRRKWLERLAARDDWAGIARDYRDTDDLSTQCRYHYAQHRLGRHAEAWQGAAKLWDSGEARPGACDSLFAAWRETPAYSPEHFWKRYGLALEKDSTAVLDALRALLRPEDRPAAGFWSRVHAQPELAEDCGLWQRQAPYGRIFAHAVERLARQDPLRAELVWSFRRGDFALERDVRIRTDRHLALELATGRHPQAAAYLASIPEPEADEAIRTWRIRVALWFQNWPGALVALDRLGAGEKRQSQWLYWRARALEALGDGTLSREFYRQAAASRDFHAYLASLRTGTSPAFSFAPFPVGADELQHLAASPSFQAVTEWLVLNRPAEARGEWMHAIQTLSGRNLLLAARLAQGWGWHRLAILALAKADGLDDPGVRYPLAYSEPVLRETRDQGPDPALVYGVIRRESAFDAEIRSPAGALGLMQIMPATGAELARRLGERWQSERALLDPAINVRYGSVYLRDLLDRYAGRWPLAAAAYNAGPARVDRWLPPDRALPADIWIETIPYGETRHYVAAVLGYALVYRARLGLGAPNPDDWWPDIEPAPRNQPPTDQPRPVTVCR